METPINRRVSSDAAVNGPRKICNGIVISRCVDCRFVHPEYSCDAARGYLWIASGPIPEGCELPAAAEDPDEGEQHAP